MTFRERQVGRLAVIGLGAAVGVALVSLGVAGEADAAGHWWLTAAVVIFVGGLLLAGLYPLLAAYQSSWGMSRDLYFPPIPREPPGRAAVRNQFLFFAISSALGVFCLAVAALLFGLSRI